MKALSGTRADVIKTVGSTTSSSGISEGSGISAATSSISSDSIAEIPHSALVEVEVGDSVNSDTLAPAAGVRSESQSLGPKPTQILETSALQRRGRVAVWRLLLDILKR